MANRNDPSSISWGRLLNQTVEKVRQQEIEIEKLKKTQLTSEEKNLTQDIRAQRDGERRRANQLLASYDSTLEDYQSLNTSLLTTAQKEQLRLNKTSLYAAQSAPAIQFDDLALQRLDNWRKQVSVNPMQQQVFAKNNSEPLVETSYDKWLKRQQSFEGAKYRTQSAAREQQRDLMWRQSEYNRSQVKADGFNTGITKDLSD